MTLSGFQSTFAVQLWRSSTVFLMRIISYTESEQQNNQVNAFVNAMDSNPFHISIQGAEGDEGFLMFLEKLQRFDTAVFMSLKGLFSSCETFLMFLRFCKAQDIRIISILDEIDTSDVIFPLPCSTHWMNILCSLQMTKGNEHDDAQSEIFGETGHDRKLKKHRMVMNLYKAGYKLSEIMKLTGYKAKSTIYLILRKYGVEIEYPSMRRVINKEKNM